MAKTISASIKQALTDRRFLVAVLVVIVLLGLSSVQTLIEALRISEVLETNFHHRVIMDALSSDAMTMALPIVVALPFTTSVVDDLKSGFIKEYLPRTSSDAYIAGRTIACVISGGTALCLGVCFAYFVAALALLPIEAAADGIWLIDVLSELWGKLMLCFVSGGFWSMVGMLLATLTGSRYMAYASPFILYYVLIILYERYFDNLYVFYPKEWINPSELWTFGNIGVIVLVSELTVIAVLCFWRTAQRRLAQI